MTAAAQRLGVNGLIVQKDNAQEAAVVPNLSVYGFENITDVVEFLNNPGEQHLLTIDGRQALASAHPHVVDLKDVKVRSKPAEL